MALSRKNQEKIVQVDLLANKVISLLEKARGWVQPTAAGPRLCFSIETPFLTAHVIDPVKLLGKYLKFE